MNISRTLTAALLACCTLLGACALTQSHPEVWQTDEVATDSQRVLWEVTALSFQKHGFPVGTGLDPSTMVATSGWKYDLAPFRGQGFRERVFVTFDSLEAGRYTINIRVQHETNMDMVRPLDLSYAEWKPAPDNEVEAQLLLLRIKSWIGTGLETGEDTGPG